MIDWLSSKIGVLIAIGVVTVFALGLFAWQHSELVDIEGQSAADDISAALDAIGDIDAATVMTMRHGSDSGDLRASIGGEQYTFNITSDSVIVTSGKGRWISHHGSGAIPHNLTERAYNLTEYGELELGGCTGEHASVGTFTIERAAIEVSGERRYVTLVYWEVENSID